MFRDRFWLTLVLTIPVVAYSQTIQQLLGFSPPDFYGSNWIGPILGSVIFFYGGLVFIQSAIVELKARQPGMMTLIAIAITAAYSYSLATTFFISGTEFFWELSTLILAMLFGHWMEMRSVTAAGSALDELAKLVPDQAELISGKKVTVSQLRIGDQFIVRPGGRIPIDGLVVEGSSSVDEAVITGESKPVSKQLDSEVIGGTLNGDGSLTVEVTTTADKTALAGIMRLVAEAQQSKSRTQLLADRAAFYLAFIAIVASLGAGFGWLVAGATTAFVIERMVSVLVIACPHALGLAVPLVSSISSKLSTQNGILIRDRKVFEAARKIDVVLFDKTGTLTTGEYGVTEVWAIPDSVPDTVLGFAAAVDFKSEHFVSRAIVKAATDKNVAIKQAQDFKRLPGRGVEALVDGKVIKVGGRSLLADSQAVPLDVAKKITAAGTEGKTVVYVLSNDRFVGAMALADTIRPESMAAVKNLKEAGIEVAMITGDAKPVANWVASELGLNQFFAEVLPEHKSDKVKELQNQGKKVAMVGDGVNDAPALVVADVGIAIGAGTDVAVESAGIILVRNDPRDISKIIVLAQATYKKMVENLIWATGYNALAIPLAAGALASVGIVLQPWLGALLMSVSTVIVAFNAQLLRGLRLNK
ncbi:heavy metal translocating P-type ATPase [Candidatus Berkelbacteria bacterium]|nr:heavy metal translocating P-type ATPase [Candidatus Berkelbacteria bacterium]